MLFFCLLFCGKTLAQPANNSCNNATNLCAGLSYSANNYSATANLCPTCEDGNAGSLFCTQPQNTVWFSFTTNTAGGNASIYLENIACLVSVGFGNGIQAVVVQATTPCNSSTYTAVSSCEDSLTGSTSLQLNGLLPSTTYYIVINGNSSGAGVTTAAHCELDLTISGPAVDITADISTTPEDCAQNDGTISVSNVQGGQAPLGFSINGSNFQPGGNFAGLSAGSYPVYIQTANGCVHYINHAVVAQTGGVSSVSMTATNSTCNNATGQVDFSNIVGGIGPYSVSFNGSPLTPGTTFSGLNSGTYLIQIVDANGCPFDTVVTVGNTTAINNLNLVVAPADCGEANGEITVTPSGGQAPYSYNLNGNTQTQNNFSGLAPGSYDLIVTDNNGCTFTQTITITENPQQNAPSVVVGTQPAPPCQGQAFTILASSQNAGSSPTYEWFVNGVSVQSGPNAVLNQPVNTGDDVICIVTAGGDCVAAPFATSNTFNINPIPVTTPTVTLTTSTNFACEGEPVTLIAEATGCNSGGQYTWMANGVPFVTNTEDTFLAVLPQSAAVSVSFQCNDPCTQSAFSNVEQIEIEEVIADAGPDRFIVQGESTVLNGSANGSVIWSPPDNLSNTSIENPVANPTNTTVYTITVTTANGCTDSDQVVVVVTPPIEVPNTFTPNGDGVNDTWEIKRIHLYPAARVTVYDRWGQRVFNTIGYTEEKRWDGTNNGLRLQAGTYFYVIDLNTGNKEFDIVNGSITIIY
ncbi:MAG: gliding motility-associated C-terminal domain-containing protein [Flavobacteriales bacterium]